MDWFRSVGNDINRTIIQPSQSGFDTKIKDPAQSGFNDVLSSANNTAWKYGAVMKDGILDLSHYAPPSFEQQLKDAGVSMDAYTKMMTPEITQTIINPIANLPSQVNPVLNKIGGDIGTGFNTTIVTPIIKTGNDIQNGWNNTISNPINGLLDKVGGFGNKKTTNNGGGGAETDYTVYLLIGGGLLLVWYLV